MKLDELTLNEKIGQKFIFGTNTDNIESIIKLIEKYSIGGVVLYRRNYNTYEEMISLIKKIKTANKGNNIPLFIAIDQEGGIVNRMPYEYHNLKNIYDSSKKGEGFVKKHANIIGKMLSELGINMNLAPVLDIYNNSKSMAIYKRCFSTDKEEVARYGLTYISELEKQNIIPVVKHFPGHGSSTIDSHRFVPYIFNYKKVLEKHIKPFEIAIKNEIDCIMLGHIAVRKMTGGLPASISKKFIDRYLRERYNYNGLVITDEINMLKRSLFYKFIYLNKALNSDNDLFLIKIKSFKEGEKIINKYKKIIKEEDLNNSLERILRLKGKFNITDTVNTNSVNIDGINKLIDKFNKEVEGK